MRAALALLLLLCVAACASPEAGRTRGGGAGADPQNHGDTIAIHGDIDMFRGTPHKGQAR